MNRFIITTLLSCISIFGFYSGSAAATEEGHQIKIRVKGLHDVKCLIGYHYGKNQFIKQDSALADANGNLLFKGKNTLPGGVYVLSMPHQILEFLVSEQNFSLETDTANLITHMKVKGSQENAVFYEYQKKAFDDGTMVDSLRKLYKKTTAEADQKALKEKMNAINKDMADFRTKWMDANAKSFAVKLIKAASEPEIPEAPKLANGRSDSTFPYRWFKAHYFDNFDMTDERLVRTPFFDSKLEYFFKNLVPQMPDSINADADKVIKLMENNKEMYKYTIWYVLNTYENSPMMGMDAVLVHIGDTYYLSGKAYWADSNTIRQIRRRCNILRNILIGKTAPDLYLTDSNGKVRTLYSVKSKYTILWFWDSDCGHCQHETPLLHDYYVKNKTKRQIEVYAATIERKPGPWKKYFREHKWGDWINVWDSFTVTDFNKMYDVYSTPVMYILDANKKIVAKRILSDQLDELFDKLDKIEEEKAKAKLKK